MEITFTADHNGTRIQVHGSIKNWTLTQSHNGRGPGDGIDQFTLEMSVDCVRTLPRDGDVTKIFNLPGTDNGTLRLWGTKSFSVSGDACTVIFNIKGLYPSKEDACAAEMEEIMTKSAEKEAYKAVSGSVSVNRNGKRLML